MQHTPVLIVGAGPTGLALAAQLQRFGVEFRIIDKHQDVLELTKSAALHARTLEHFRDLGIIDRILDEGQRVDILRLRTGHRDRLGVDFRDLRDVAYPHMVDIPQARTEHILIDHVTGKGATIERGVTCTGLEQSADGVLVAVTNPDGGTATIAADWVVGCDGVHSTVRSLVGIDFLGEPYADDWVLCDAEVDWPLPRNEMTFSADSDGIYGVFPLPGARRYRLAYTQSRTPSGDLVEPDLNDAQRAMARTGIDGTIRSVDQFWTFNLSHKQATGYRSGRVFLAGDAGHVHTPFGGQGLNLGVGDAINLGWKLAGVVNERAPASLLETYEAERRHVAAQVVTFTHLGAQAMLLRNDPRRYLRDAAFTVLQGAEPARKRLATQLSQIGHRYPASGRGGTLRGGERIPDPEVFDGVTNRRVRLHDLLPSDRFTAVVAGRGDSAELRPACDLLTTLCRQRPDVVGGLTVATAWEAARQATQHIPVVLDRGEDAAALYGRGPAMYIVRPDRHIGYAGGPDRNKVERYLATVINDARVAAQ